MSGETIQRAGNYRAGAIEVFLSKSWKFGDDREQTRRAAAEFLNEVEDEDFFALVLNGRVTVHAIETTLMAYAVSASIYASDIAPGGGGCACGFQLVTFDHRVERLPYAEVRSVVFGTLTYALAASKGAQTADAEALAKTAGGRDPRGDGHRVWKQ